MNDKLIKLSKEYLLAKERYESAVLIEVRTSPIMKDKNLFWDMIKDLSDFVQRSILKREDPVRYGIQEWLREMQVKCAECYNIEDFPTFIRTYSKLKESIAKKLVGILDGNKLSDVIDSLPLAGKQPCLRVLVGEVKTVEDLYDIVDGNLVQLILDKENHVEQWLEQVYVDKLSVILALS